MAMQFYAYSGITRNYLKIREATTGVTSHHLN